MSLQESFFPPDTVFSTRVFQRGSITVFSANCEDFKAILELKARYARAMDTKQWDDYGDCLTEDIDAQFDGMPRPSRDLPTVGRMHGRASIVQQCREWLNEVVTMHIVFLPEITLTSPTTAKGIWAFRDELHMKTCIFTGQGHYHEDYVKQGHRWRIARLKATRVHVKEVWI